MKKAELFLCKTNNCHLVSQVLKSTVVFRVYPGSGKLTLSTFKIRSDVYDWWDTYIKSVFYNCMKLQCQCSWILLFIQSMSMLTSRHENSNISVLLSIILSFAVALIMESLHYTLFDKQWFYFWKLMRPLNFEHFLQFWYDMNEAMPLIHLERT